VRVLIAEPDPQVRQDLVRMLEDWGYTADAVADGAEAWLTIQQPDPPRMVLLDWELPNGPGAELCQRIRSLKDGRYVYIISLSDGDRCQCAIDMLGAGADDCLSKPAHPGELRARLRAACRILDLQSELLTTQEALREQATVDAMTGLPNRSAILEVLRREVNRAQRGGKPLGVIIADIDHFKWVNDARGHEAGDSVLCEIAQRMWSHIRSYDSIGRYGGEEFLITVPGSDSRAAVALGERIRRACESVPVRTGGEELEVTVSFGVSVAPAHCSIDADDMIRMADEALYRAKRSGRNRVALAESDATLAG